MHRLVFLSVALCHGAAVTLGGQPLRLIPYPQVAASAPGEFTVTGPVAIGVASEAAADGFAADLLAEDLRQFARVEVSAGTPNPRSPILLGRRGAPLIDAQIARRKLDAAALGKPESYLLSVDASGVLVAAGTDEGLFYGVQTLRQLLRPDDGRARFPYVSIADWPVLRYRGLSVDVSRGPVPADRQLFSIVRTCAEFKLNVLSLYMEHVFPYAHTPMVAPAGGEIPPELMRRLVDYAARYHIEIVPQQQMFGHLHHLLKLERYTEMAEVPYGHVLAAQDERGYEWTRRAAAQLTECTRSRFLHIGSDETWELGRGRSREAAERLGVGNVYIEHLTRVSELLKPLNRKLMFWGDIALNHPELVPKLPKELIAMTWTYDPKEDFSDYIVPFRKAGLQVFVCPGLNNWNRIFPNFTNALGNINNFVGDGKKHGVLGMLNTDWKDDGETLFNMGWYGIAFSAAAAWQTGPVNVDAFDRAFDWAYFRSDGETFTKAIRQLDRIHGLLGVAGSRDGNNEWTWFEPFTRRGAERVRRALPAASGIRRLAEDTWIEVTAHAPRARRRRDELELIRFAAKRFDYVGMKLQTAQAIADAYREELPAGGTLRAADLRDAIHELKGMYRELWLAENRPHWIDNVLIRYDHEAMYWLRIGRLVTAARQEMRETKTLPAPESLGLVLP